MCTRQVFGASLGVHVGASELYKKRHHVDVTVSRQQRQRRCLFVVDDGFGVVAVSGVHGDGDKGVRLGRGWRRRRGRRGGVGWHILLLTRCR